MNRVYLVELARHLPPSKKHPKGKGISYYVLRWAGTNGRTQQEPLGRSRKTGGKITRAEAVAMRATKELALGSGKVKIDKPAKMDLSSFLEYYKERRRKGDEGRGHLRGAPKLSDATITDHAMTLRYMIRNFGNNRVLSSMNLNDASLFIDALEAGELVNARKKSKQKYGLGKQTIKGHIRNAKAIFNWAHRFGIVSDNPFADFDGKPLPTEPNHYVDIKTFEKIIKSKDISHGWKTMFGLCRLAGLRREAARTLPWASQSQDSEGKKHWIGIDWDRRRVCVIGNSKTKKKYREVPICLSLYSILLEAHNDSNNDADSITGQSINNLYRRGQAVLANAKVIEWPKLFQAMRSSCENDWKQKGVAEATYCAWIGHSPKVSREYYVAPTEAEYEAIITMVA